MTLQDRLDAMGDAIAAWGDVDEASRREIVIFVEQLVIAAVLEERRKWEQVVTRAQGALGSLGREFAAGIVTPNEVREKGGET